jgi:Ca-activated chloride channel family protein
MVEVTFANPVYLWTLLLLPFMIVIHILILKKIKTAALKFSNFEAIERVSKGDFLGKRYNGLFTNKNVFLLLLRLLVYSMLIFSVTGTILWYVGESSDFDYVLAIDTSTSMLADDFKISRLEAAKDAANLFVDSSIGKSNIGVVSFASTIFVDKELTSDKNDVREIIEKLDVKESGGTNIGDAIITSVNLLDGGKAKIIILLTDGQSNIGTSPDVAVDYANSKAVIIHTIGMGTEAGGKIFGLNITSKLDEQSLKRISLDTNGKYFKAESEDVLKDAFKEIATFKEKKVSLNISWILLIIGFSLLAVEWILVHSIYRTIP